jgi:flavin reductase (DIM6/NTAB) family NADH-FMN oxidoreductase RutF
MFSAGAGANDDRLKDSARNIEETGEFVCNLATWETREQMNHSSIAAGPEVDEIALSGLTAIPSRLVKAPRIAEAPVHLECRFIKSVEVPGWTEADNYRVIFGEVIGIHIDDSVLTDEGLVDIRKMGVISRLGYNDYARVDAESVFSMGRPVVERSGAKK